MLCVANISRLDGAGPAWPPLGWSVSAGSLDRSSTDDGLPPDAEIRSVDGRVARWRARADAAADRYQKRAQDQPLLGLPLARLLAPARTWVLIPLIAMFAVASTWFGLYLMTVGWAP